MRDTLFRTTIEVYVRQSQQPFAQMTAQFRDTTVFSLGLINRQRKRRAHADDLMRRQRARTKTAFVPAAVDLCL